MSARVSAGLHLLLRYCLCCLLRSPVWRSGKNPRFIWKHRPYGRCFRRWFTTIRQWRLSSPLYWLTALCILRPICCCIFSSMMWVGRAGITAIHFSVHLAERYRFCPWWYCFRCCGSLWAVSVCSTWALEWQSQGMRFCLCWWLAVILCLEPWWCRAFWFLRHLACWPCLPQYFWQIR